MTASAPPSAAAPPVKPPIPVAVIDVGSNSIRMCVAELSPDGRINELEYLTQPVRLGVDTFRRGRIGGPALQSACAVLSGFRKVMETYGVRRYRAVATSAVREAANSDAFLDRVLVTTGLQLENVEGIEESRLQYQMVRNLLAGRHGLATDNSMIFSLGSGSAEITVLEAGKVLFSETRRIGTLRLLEVLDTHSEKSTRRLLGVFLNDVAGSVRRLHPDLDLQRFFVICPDLRRVVRELEDPADAKDAARDRSIFVIPRKRLDDFAAGLIRIESAERARKFGMNPDEVETLLPAVTAVQSFWRVTRAREAVLLDVSMLDSLLLDLSLRQADPATPDITAPAEPPAGPAVPEPIEGLPLGGTEADFRAQVLSSAVGLGRRYHFDEPHALHVQKLALQLFDQLSALHGLGAHDRLLLEIAAVLHDIGLYISPTSHHKHSMYLIRNSELMGLNRDDLHLIAIVVRYHRRSMPRPQHPEFAGLPRRLQVTVGKLASILRMAEALDRSHAQTVRGVAVQLSGSEAMVTLDAADDLSLEEWSLRNKTDLFESLYGYTVRLRIRQAGPGAA